MRPKRDSPRSAQGGQREGPRRGPRKRPKKGAREVSPGGIKGGGRIESISHALHFMDVIRLINACPATFVEITGVCIFCKRKFIHTN